ncbi:MAG: C39 family peptidase [Candidatus Omnitrophica bacterium]|nr:C39 family peptidase [Candidatus Omnitrophota bacterium]
MKRLLITTIGLLISFSMALPGYAMNIGFGGMRMNVKVKNYREMRNRNIVQQGIDYSCGPASLATLLTFYLGEDVSEAEVIEYLLDNLSEERWALIEERHGFSLLDLKVFAQNKGFEAAGYRMDLEGLLELGKPVIIPIRVKNYDHFVVFRGAKGNRAYLADPALGNRSMLLSQLGKIWKGVGLVVQRPSEDGEEGGRYPLAIGKEESLMPQDIVAGQAITENQLSNYVSFSEF